MVVSVVALEQLVLNSGIDARTSVRHCELDDLVPLHERHEDSGVSPAVAYCVVEEVRQGAVDAGTVDPQVAGRRGLDVDLDLGVKEPLSCDGSTYERTPILASRTGEITQVVVGPRCG